MMISKYFSSLAIAVILAGCGGSSTSSNKNNNISGVIVDPYIEGAILCEDVNKNNSCDENEQVSSASNSKGGFLFSKELTVGSNVIVKTPGKHNGVEYSLKLSGVVDENKEIKVISPLTTLETKGLSKTQIKNILTTAGISSLSTDDISSDPMDGLSGKTSLNDAELNKLQASLATYGLLKIMEGSDALSALSGDDLVNSTEVASIASVMVTNIKNALSQTTFANAKAVVDSAKSQAGIYASYVPDMTSDVVIKTAVTVMDRLIEAGYTACNESGGDVNTALSAVNTASSDILPQVGTIGQYYYGLVNKSALDSAPNVLTSALPSEITAGRGNTTGVVVLDESNTRTTRRDIRIPINDIPFFIELNGGTLGDGTIDIIRNYSSIKSIQISGTNEIIQTINFTDDKASISSSLIDSGKNKISLVLSDYETRYFYIYKGSYDAVSYSATDNGDSSYTFSSVKASGNTANDLFVHVQNNNDPASNKDNKWLIFLPSDANTISVTNLKSTGGYRVDSLNYEKYIVASANNENTGQEVSMTYDIDVRLIDTSKKITGTFKKDENSIIQAFDETVDATDGNIWLHAHYTHATAAYSSVCKTGSTVCTQADVSNEKVWVAAQDMHLENINDPKASYNFTTGEYEIAGLADEIGYTILAFWQNKNIQGTFYNVISTTGNDIVLQSESGTVDGSIATSDTKVRLARVITFSGEPNYVYSEIKTKDSSNNFSFSNYQYDTTGTKTYLLWGAQDGDLELTEGKIASCTDLNKCKEITVNSTTTTIHIQ